MKMIIILKIFLIWHQIRLFNQLFVTLLFKEFVLLHQTNILIAGEINENLLLGFLSYSICAPPTASNKSISDIPSPSLVKLVDKDFSCYTPLDFNEVSNLMSDLGLSSLEATRKAAKFAAVQVFAKNQFASPSSVTPLRQVESFIDFDELFSVYDVLYYHALLILLL
ncbi:unnamed protein product [Rhizophagus irregularis]|nr:unnamed protein product [Rhizophagus irregularis]CAB5387913.1 unnamed protein product [Rhizophagus irregularis]